MGDGYRYRTRRELLPADTPVEQQLRLDFEKTQSEPEPEFAAK